jgi:hypothetical protein
VQEALRLVTPAVRERYQRRGKQAGFGADALDAASPMVWVQQQRVRFQDTSERETLVSKEHNWVPLPIPYLLKRSVDGTQVKSEMK